MLLELRIHHLVLIESLKLELTPGFNVLTGETGAGKSMIIDALGLVLGGRAQPDLVRREAREAEVEALFEVEPGSRLMAKLEAAGIPCERELIIRRVVQAEGRSRAFANGRICTASQLAELAPDLCDIASQHESVSLTDPSTHLEYLDAFGHLDASRAALAEEVRGLSEIVRELEEVRALDRARAEREDLLTFQAKEIDELSPREGEETELEQEQARLRHAAKLRDTARRTWERLYEAENALCDELARLASELHAAADYDGSLVVHARTLDTSRAELNDVARALERYADGIEANPIRLAEVEERLFRLQKLLRKHGPTTADLLRFRREIDAELASLAGAEERLAMLDDLRAKKLASVTSHVRTLSRERQKAAERLADAIGRELGLLAMGRARVIVDVMPLSSNATSDLVVDGARLSPSGIDRVEFLIAPNRGEEPRPLRKIASGGELSRALLALKRVLAEKGPAGLYVFDEVDAGVGGRVAEVIGHSIADIARHRQVLCITHLPQIAALADAHFVVDKSESNERTRSSVRRLANTERVEEIARMIGGVRVGSAARRAAEEMLRK